MAAGLVACGSDKKTTTESTTVTTSATKPSATVSIDMNDFAYTVSGPLTAGGTLKISNKGKELHMLGIGKLKQGKTLDDVKKALSEQGPPGGGDGGGATTTAVPGARSGRSGGATTTTAGGATTTTAAGGGEEKDPTAEFLDQIGLPGGVQSPGQSAEVTVPNLAPGSYALICFIPGEGDGAPHFAKGMINQLEVVAGTAPSAPTADATYKVASGTAVEGPAKLTPGKHTLRIDAASGSGPLEPGLAQFNPGTTPDQFGEAINKIFESKDPPPPGTATSLPGQIIYGGFDLNDITGFYLTVDLKPGNYYIVADDTDVPNPPKPAKEVINITVA